MGRAKNNYVELVGIVEEVNTEIRETADGRKYISGKVAVKCGERDGKANIVDAKILAFEKTKAGAISKQYTSYTTLDKYLHQKVKITAELREGSMPREDGSALIKFNEIYAKFINTARPEEEEACKFNFSGFVTKPLYERKNKDDELIGWRFEVAQANYNDSAISVIRFDVDKNDSAIAEAIEQNYASGMTVSFSGEISYTTTIETVEQAVAFGQAAPKTLVRSEKSYRVTGGNEPYGDDAPETYSDAEIVAFCDAYKAADAKRLEDIKAKAAAPAAPATNSVASGMAAATRRSALI